MADQLGELAEQVEGELTQARLAYALAAAARDSRSLDAAADRFEAIGALLYAAEALGESAVHFAPGGPDPRGGGGPAGGGPPVGPL